MILLKRGSLLKNLQVPEEFRFPLPDHIRPKLPHARSLTALPARGGRPSGGGEDVDVDGRVHGGQGRQSQGVGCLRGVAAPKRRLHVSRNVSRVRGGGWR